MSSIEETPQIITGFPLEYSPSAGQCDACPAGMAIAWLKQDEDSPTAQSFICPPMRTIRLDAQHWVIHAFSLFHPVLLNDSALALVQHFNNPRELDDLPLSWVATWGAEAVQGVLKQMIQLGLLVPEEVTDHSSV